MATTKTPKINALEDYFVFRASLDSIGIWTISGDIAEEFSLVDRPEVVRELTIKVVSDLLERGLVRPGSPTTEGSFEVWPYEASESVIRIERDWEELDSPLPDLGDIVWFEATDKGNQHVVDYSPEESGLKLEQIE